MSSPNENEKSIKAKHNDLCFKLNVDRVAANISWDTYKRISKNCSLDGDQMHWLSCSLYVACRSSVTPTLQSGKAVEGNCVSLTRLLRLCNISLIQFFNKIEKWMEMASLPTDFRSKIERLKRKFAVSTLLFQKFKPIFQEIFIGLPEERTKSIIKGNKKQKLSACSTQALFELTWCLFICVKAEFHNSADNLVDMYHVLLSCLDYIFENAFIAKRYDLFNKSFKGLPDGFGYEQYVPPKQAPCIISVLCDMKEGLPVEAQTIKEYNWRPIIKTFFEKGILKGDNFNEEEVNDIFTGILDIGSFDVNLKSLNNLYETFVLSVGEFDERIFLGEHANNYIGSPIKSSEDDEVKSFDNFGLSVRAQEPATPLTGRRYLKARSEPLTPVSQATNSVARLRTYLTGCKPQPSAQLLQLFKDSNVDEEIMNASVIVPCNRWVEQFTASLLSSNCSNETSLSRSQIVASLYYKVLDYILREEKRKKPMVSLQMLINQEIFQQTLFACCAEVVLHAYGVNSMRFPHVLHIFKLDAFNFYKIIELVVQALMVSLSRDSIKHLNAVEEQALECLVWHSDSPLWARIQSGSVPSTVEVSHKNDIQDNNAVAPLHAVVAAQQRRLTNGILSPVSTATDRFLTPNIDQAKKQLFKDTIKPGQSLLVKDQTPPAPVQPPQPTTSDASTTPTKGNKNASLVLFFRKFYGLAVVRMNDLCTRLRLNDTELRRKIWTCLEFSIMHQTQLMQDRHLDQLLMCAVYVICKVSNNPASNPVERTFTEIMRCYRQQPQADNHVYRSVFIGGENKDERGDLIQFYNKVYVQCMQSFALRFTGRHKDECSLSPLPAGRGDPSWSPAGGQRVSDRYHLFVKPLTSPPPANHHLTYRFSRSPAKDLHDINSMLACEISVKRNMEIEGTVEGDVLKRTRHPPAGVARKLQGLMTDRQTV